MTHRNSLNNHTATTFTLALLLMMNHTTTTFTLGLLSVLNNMILVTKWHVRIYGLSSKTCLHSFHTKFPSISWLLHSKNKYVFCDAKHFGISTMTPPLAFHTLSPMHYYHLTIVTVTTSYNRK